MRIGSISKRTGVPVSTIRYYIQIGLLVPENETTQYEFDERDCQTLEKIVRFKNWGLSLDTIHRLISLGRLSEEVEPHSKADCLALLRAHQEELEAACKRNHHYIEEIDRYIEENDLQTPNRQYTEKRDRIGIPLRSLNLLCCPACGAFLQVNHACMDLNYLYDGELNCQCGYCAPVQNGIIYSSHQKVYSNDTPDIDRSLYRSAPNELVSLIQKSYNWIESRVHDFVGSDGKVIMETHLNSFFYLYKQMKHLNKDNIYIVQDKFSSIIELYKSYLEQMNTELQIIYIVSSDEVALPIRSQCVDLLIDYNSTNEYGIYSRDFYLDKMYKFLKTSSVVLGAYYYFDSQSKSLARLKESYPKNHPGNYTLFYLTDGLKTHYSIIKQSEIGETTDSGSGVTFVFHCKGDPLHLRCFMLKPLPQGKTQHGYHNRNL